MRRRRASLSLACVLLAASLLMASCGGGADQSASSPPCSSPPAGIGPDATATLQVEDNGTTVCLRVRDELTVFLRVAVDQESSGWGPVQASNVSVLQAMNTGILTLPRGVTGAVYRVVGTGSVQLTSVRPPCAGPGAGCGPDEAWRVTIVALK